MRLRRIRSMRAVVQQIADGGVRAAGGHLALDADRAGLAVAIDDGEFLVQRRHADGAHPVLVGAVAAHPAGLRHAVHLQQLDAVHLLELQPLLRRERRRRAAHQAQRRHVLGGVAERLVQQHVQHGRHAGREGDAVVADPFEEVAVGEALGDVQRQALLQERHQAQHLRRVPAERAVFQRAVVRGEAEEFQRREAVEPVGAVVVDHDLGPAGGAGGAEDAGDVVGRVALGQLFGAVACGHHREAFVLRIGGAVCRPRRRNGRAAPCIRRPARRNRCPCDGGSAPGSPPAARSASSFSLISILSGQTTAPMRQMPNQSSSFSRFSSDSSRTRLPLTTPRLLRKAAMSVVTWSSCAEADAGAGFEIDDRGLAGIAVAGNARTGPRPGDRGCRADGRRTRRSSSASSPASR